MHVYQRKALQRRTYLINTVIGGIWTAFTLITVAAALFQFIINSLIDEDYEKNITDIRNTFISTIAMLTAVIVYFTILRKRIGYFYEYLLFYDELTIEVEVDKCAKEFAKPLNIQNIKLNQQIIGMKDSHSSCYKLSIKSYATFNCPVEMPGTTRKKPPADSRFFHTNTIKKDGKISNNSLKDIVEQDTASGSDFIDCIVCFNKKVDSFFLPCGHSGACMECSEAILKSSSTCHFCRSVKYYIENLGDSESERAYFVEYHF